MFFVKFDALAGKAHDPPPQIAAVRGRRLGFRRTDHRSAGLRGAVELFERSRTLKNPPIIPPTSTSNQKSAVYRWWVRYVRGRGVEKRNNEARKTSARAACGAHNQPRRVIMKGEKTVKEYVSWGRVQRERFLFLFSFFGVGRGTENLEGDGEACRIGGELEDNICTVGIHGSSVGEQVGLDLDFWQKGEEIRSQGGTGSFRMRICYATDANIAAVVNKPPSYLHSSRVKIKFLEGINDGGGSKLQRQVFGFLVLNLSKRSTPFSGTQENM
ncbi:hypothetical protein DFH08DRAFT_810684 [Mycena albidolilacea]|uniref:Uncharacterized protein n=1 Tax=Mycena albidolilacea TaxID=1033008 RepID=A0AAD6ZWW4_9AGAR|nr:hypothetical protein DFH08DRAFT_810684 [Mycena albidolilacea]